MSLWAVLQHKRSHNKLQPVFDLTLNQWSASTNHGACIVLILSTVLFSLHGVKVEGYLVCVLLCKCLESFCRASVFGMRSATQFTYFPVSNQSCHLSWDKIRRRVQHQKTKHLVHWEKFCQDFNKNNQFKYCLENIFSSNDHWIRNNTTT